MATTMPIATRSEESILIREPCTLLNGIPRAGVIIITDTRIIFESSSGLTRLFGARSHIIELGQLKSISLVPNRPRMTIKTATETHVYRGRAIPRVYSRLQALIDHANGLTNSLYEPDEPVVLAGRLILLVNRMIGAAGEFVLTDRRLRFVAGEGLVPRMWSGLGRPIDIPLNQIETVEMVGVRRRINLSTKDCRYQFGGRLAPQLYSHLMASAENRVQEDDVERVLESWKVNIYSGPLASPGRLVLSTHRMHFEPGRRLDAALGVKGQSICWYEVNSIRFKGRLNKRLLFDCGDRSITVDVDSPAQRFLDLISLYRESIGPLEPEVDADVEISEGAARFILQRWDEYLNMGRLAVVVGATPALHWCDSWWMRRGWLVLTAQQLLFIPSGPPRASNGVVVLPLTDCSLGKHADGDGGLERLILESGNQSFVFSPLAGSSFVDRVAQLCGQGARSGWDQEWGAQFVPLIGEAAFAEFEVDNVVVETLRPAHLFPHEDGIGVFTRNPPDPRLHVGANTVFHVSSTDGVYQLRGAVVVNERIATGQGDAEDMAFLIVIAQSPQLNLTDRRRHFRVGAAELMAGRCMAYSMTRGWYETKHPLRLTLKNLSLSGCAIYSNRELEAGSQVMLYLPPRTKPLRLQAKVIESVQSPDGPQPWFARVQFLQIDKSDTRFITEQIVRFQQVHEQEYSDV